MHSNLCNYLVLSGPEILLLASEGMSLSFESFKKGMSEYHIVYLLANIYKTLSHQCSQCQGHTPQFPDQGKGHMTISLICMSLLYSTPS